MYQKCGDVYSAVPVRRLPIWRIAFWTSIASRESRGALLGSHGSRAARLSGSRGVLRGSHGLPRMAFARPPSRFARVSRGTRGASSGFPWGSREALVRLFGTRLGSVGLLRSPCHPPSSSLLVLFPPLVGLRRAQSGSSSLLLLPFGLYRLPSGSVWLLPAPSGSVGLRRALESSVGISSGRLEIETFRTLVEEASRSSHQEFRPATPRLLHEAAH